MIRPILFLLAVSALGSCGGSGSSPTEPNAVAITFEYAAPTAIDPDVDFPGCSDGGASFGTHLHFTWNGWEDRRLMRVQGSDLFTYTADVPTGRDLRVALHDPNNCLSGSGVYVAPENLRANGVLLSRVVEVTIGTGVAMRVESDGRVIP